ncbi:MAG: O-antigen ligase family protein [Endomicrobiales bacterium]|nr:O-antigen ligase family protein [Endomicrobiales bacterium]
MSYLLSIFIFLNTFLPKVGFRIEKLPFHLNITDIIFIVLLVYIIPKIIKEKLYIKFYPLFILFAWGIISALNGYFSSALPVSIFDEFTRQYLLIFTALITFLGLRSKNNKVFLFFVTAICLVSIYGICESILGVKFTALSHKLLIYLGYPVNAFDHYMDFVNEGRIRTTLLSWNASGQYLASASFFVISRALLDKNISSKTKTIYIIISIMAFMCVILTRSRSSWIAIFATSILFSVAVLKKRFWVVPAALVMILAVLSICNPKVFLRIKSFHNLKDDGPAAGRVLVVKESFQHIKKAPFMGYGLGMYYDKKIPATVFMYFGMDCFYAKYALSNGITGLALFLFSIIWLFHKIIREYKKSDITNNWMLMGSIFAITSMLIGSVFDSMLTITTFAIAIFWFYYGLSLKSLYEDN